MSIHSVMNNTSKFIQNYSNNTFGFKVVSYNEETGMIDTIRVIKMQ